MEEKKKFNKIVISFEDEDMAPAVVKTIEKMLQAAKEKTETGGSKFNIIKGFGWKKTRVKNFIHIAVTGTNGLKKQITELKNLAFQLSKDMGMDDIQAQEDKDNEE